ncbi:MAG: DNA-binding response regulator [Chloroflexota bacterium]|nr:MAG: DNA-binding response regulator [Chloroflexota bacterium]
MATILIVEDEPELVKVMRSYLEQAGHAVLTAYRGDTGLSTWEHRRPDLVILDLNLPGMDGLDVAREIRRKAETPLIMLTARVEEADRLIGLEIGADDYITKPFSPREVVARVRAVLRRAGATPAASQMLRAGDLEVDLDSHTVSRAGQIIELTPTEFNLLAALVAQPGRAFSRLQLLETAQGTAYEGYERTIDAHIKNLRAKLEPDPKNPRYIETVFGVGYRFRKEAA